VSKIIPDSNLLRLPFICAAPKEGVKKPKENRPEGRSKSGEDARPCGPAVGHIGSIPKDAKKSLDFFSDFDPRSSRANFRPTKRADRYANGDGATLF
jgi:hypothetical protein